MFGRLVFAGLLASVLCGCHNAHVNQPLTQTLGGSDPDAQMEFWHQLETRPVTCNDDAFHALFLYMDEKDDAADYSARVAELKSRRMLPRDFHAPANDAVHRGSLAVALVRILHIKGGWALHVFGQTNERYAVRELVYKGLYPPSSPQQTFSGTEFLGIMGKAEDYRRDNNPEPSPSSATQPAETATPQPFGHGISNKPAN
jgi:hypothetical protein